jgi:hypothetical protein
MEYVIQILERELRQHKAYAAAQKTYNNDAEVAMWNKRCEQIQESIMILKMILLQNT